MMINKLIQDLKKEFQKLSNPEKLDFLDKVNFAKEWWYERKCLTCKYQSIYGEPSDSKMCIGCKDDKYEEQTQEKPLKEIIKEMKNMEKSKGDIIKLDKNLKKKIKEKNEDILKPQKRKNNLRIISEDL